MGVMASPNPDDPRALMAQLRAALDAPPKPGAWGGGRAVFGMAAPAAARHIGCDRVTLWKWLTSGRVLGAHQRGRLRPTWKVPHLWARAARAALDRGEDLVACGVLAPVRPPDTPEQPEAPSDPPAAPSAT